MCRILFPALIVISLFASCSGSAKPADGPATVPDFPYQEYLDSMSEDDMFPTIGDDGGGFNAISHKIRYPQVPSGLTLSSFGDSLLQFYNTCVAFNTMAYDISTAERYIDSPEIVADNADALDSINVSGIRDVSLRTALADASRKAAEMLREGKMVNGNEEAQEEVKRFYDDFDATYGDFLNTHFKETVYSPSDIMENYDGIHAKVLSDSTYLRDELLQMILNERDFEKKCILARELAYSCYLNPDGDPKELVAVLDGILRTDGYSPLLRELWLMWRTALQKGILSGMSNDSAMYNLLYNDMRNRAALAYIVYLDRHPDDELAFYEFYVLATTYNITRNACNYGNNSLIDAAVLYGELLEGKDQ